MCGESMEQNTNLVAAMTPPWCEIFWSPRRQKNRRDILGLKNAKLERNATILGGNFVGGA